MSAETIVLLPCPFCGSAATISHPREHVVSCSSPKFCFGKTTYGFMYPEDAARHWNKRAPAAAQRQEQEGGRG